jgi:signal transduction histidine kinase
MDEQARRIAEELHDGAMQEVTLARLQIDLLGSGVEDTVLLEELAGLSDMLGAVAHRMQALMRTLTGGETPALVQKSSPSR